MTAHALRRTVTISLLAVVLGAAGLMASPTAHAAPGSSLASFDATATAGVPACGSGIGTGIAFDGATLYLSCWGSNVLQRVNAATHASGGAPLTVAGMSDIGALAFSSIHTGIYACQGGNTVFLITGIPALPVGASQFPVVGCIDGLAYDGITDTIWASPDANDCIYHYSLGPPNGPAGTLIASFCGLTAKLGGSGNSGIGVGGSTLYLANNGGSQIYQCDKGLVTCTLLSTFPRRIEDLECDDVTFAPKSAIWSVDAYDRILNAWEIPAGTCGIGGGASKAVGGIADLHTGGADSAGSAAAYENSGGSAAGYAAIGGVGAAALMALTLAGWYTRRRWLR